MKRFDGKSIVVTGAGRGLGFAYAERLASEGAFIVIAEINEELGAGAAAQLAAKGYENIFVPTDIASEDSIEKLANEVARSIPPLHGIVANAAWADNVGGKAYHEIDASVWDKMMAINVRGTWLTIKRLAPVMLNGGSIVTIASSAVFVGTARLLHYVTSKAAILGMTGSLARELASREIRVNCVSPGLTVVEVTRRLPPEKWKEYGDMRLFKRDQVPEDLSGVIAFLMSDDSRFITGQTLAVDGGMTLG